MKTVTCPIVDWYQLHTCTITTCKNYTEATQHHCLELDRKKPEGTKQFSDSELNLYKFRHKQVGTRVVQIYRKNAIQRVKCILILHKFIDWLESNYSRKTNFRQKVFLDREREYPLKIKRLGWQNWMWGYLLDGVTWDTFTQRMEGECSEYSVAQLLDVKPEQFEVLVQTLYPKRHERKYHEAVEQAYTSHHCPG